MLGKECDGVSQRTQLQTLQGERGGRAEAGRFKKEGAVTTTQNTITVIFFKYKKHVEKE